MPANNENYIGVAMGLDVTDLKAGLSEANKQIKLANSEFKAASSGMDDWTKSTEGITAKVKQLDTVLKLQKSKLAGLNAEYDKVVKSQGENSEAARKLKVQINNQKAVVNATQREFDNYTETLKQAEAGTLDLETASLKGGKAVQKTGEAAKEAGDGFTVAKGAIAGFIANGLTALVGAAKNAVSSLLGLAESTREYRRTMATLETAATDVDVSTDYIRDKFNELSGVFDDQDSLTEGLNNLLTAGFDEKSLDGITKGLEGAALKWKDTLKFEGLADSLQEWIGSGGANLTGNFAELLERMGYNLEEFQAQTAGMTDEQRRNYAANILNSEGLNKVSDSYREQNKDMVAAQEANARYQETVGEMGERIEPITTKIREGFTRILEKILELTENTDFEAFAAKIDGAFTVFINDIMPKIIVGLQWIIDNKDTIIAGVVGIGAAFVAWKVVGIVQSATKAMQGMTAAQWLLNVAMNANPIGIIIALIAGLVAGFVVLWNKSEGFRNFWIGLWDGLKKAVGVAVDWIKNNWQSMLLFLVNPVAGVFKYLYDNFDGFREFVDGLVSKIKNLFAKMWNGIKSVFSNVKEFFRGKVEDIVSAFSNIKEKFLSTGENIVKGIWEGIKNGAKWLKDKITGFAGNVAGWFKDTFKIKSPSKLIEDEVGVYVGQAVVPSSPSALAKVKKRLSAFTDYVSDNLGGIKSGLAINATGAYSGAGVRAAGGNTVVNAGMTVNYNGTLSRKKLKQLENDNYTAIKMRLRAEGAI